MSVAIDVKPGCVSPTFYPLLANHDRRLLLWGGRDSTKSDFVALKLLLNCLALPYFKCILIRKIADTIADSQWATIKAVAEREGLDHLFFFGTSPLVIRCLVNKNLFVARGLDNPKKIKSTKDPTHAWYEEANEDSEDEVDVVSTTLRTSRPGAVIQEIITFNPDHKGDYKEFWLWKKFFRDTGHSEGTTFSGSMDTEVDGELVKLPFTVVHSTIRDNPWAPKERVALYKSYGDLNPATGKPYNAYKYRVWYQGLWTNKQTGNEWYYQFVKENHVRQVPYLEGVTIFQSWDANADPYSAMICAQLEYLAQERLRLRVFKEYAIRGAAGGLRATARQFVLDWQAQWPHSSVAYTGDASMRNRRPGSPQESPMKDVEAELRPVSSGGSNLWLRHNPSVLGRRDWINSLWAGEDPSIEIWIDEHCTELIQDIELTQKGIGEKLKETFPDPEKGVTYQIRGHFTDCLEYLLASRFPDRLQEFLRRGAKR